MGAVVASLFMAGILLYLVRAHVTAVEEEQVPNDVYYCPYHNSVYTDERAAHSHAVAKHNAPRDGDAWKTTLERYDVEDRGRRSGKGGGLT
jgi:hypothetical protein